MEINAANNTTVIVNFENNAIMTLEQCLNSSQVKALFALQYSLDLLPHLTYYNDIKTEAIPSNRIKDLEVTEDTSLTFDICFELSSVQSDTLMSSNTSAAGIVHLNKGYIEDGISKDVPIINGVTRVRDVISDSVANFFSTTVDNMVAMEVTIDDVKASMSSVLHDGETVRFTTPKAGDKGSSVFVNVEIRNLSKKTVTDVVKIVEAGSSLKDLVDYYKDRTEGIVHAFSIDGDKLSTNDLVYNASLPLYTFTEGISYTVILMVEESNTSCGGICSCCNSCKEDYTEHEDPDYCEDDDYADDDYEDEYEDGDEFEEDYNDDVEAADEEDEEDVFDSAAPGAPGTVTVYYAMGNANATFDIRNRLTTLDDIVFSDRMMHLQNINIEQAKGLKYAINDVSVVDIEKAVLYDGDNITICPRSAGDKGKVNE